MNAYRVFKAIAWFFFFMAIAVIIPELTIEWFNFRQFPLSVKMMFVFAAGIMGIGKLFQILQEVAN